MLISLSQIRKLENTSTSKIASYFPIQAFLKNTEFLHSGAAIGKKNWHIKRAWLQDPWKWFLHLLVNFISIADWLPILQIRQPEKADPEFKSHLQASVSKTFNHWQFQSWFRNFHEENPTTRCQLACEHNRCFGAIFKHLKLWYTPGGGDFLRSLNTIHEIKLKID